MAGRHVAPTGPAATSPGPGYDGRVTGSTPTTPPDATVADAPQPVTPGERRLAHPPSDRYRAAEAAAAEAPDPAASIPRGVAVATVVGIVGAVVIAVLGGVLAVSAGLVVVAAAIGWAVAMALRVGARERLTRSGRVRLAVGLALAAITLGQLGLWLYARTLGGVLPPLNYLGQVFGFLVPAEFTAAAIIAWVSAR